MLCADAAELIVPLAAFALPTPAYPRPAAARAEAHTPELGTSAFTSYAGVF